MPGLVAGVVVLGLLLLLMSGYTRASPKGLAKGVKFSGGVALGLLTLFLAARGQIGFALLSGGVAWGLLFGTMPPWLRPPASAGSTGARRGSSSGPQASPPRSGNMTRTEALKVLGLEEGASEQDVRSAHRRLIQQTHPDKGGTSYLAAKINEAKDVLIGRRR